MNNIQTYESFLSKLFKKKKRPFVPDTEHDGIGFVKPCDELQQALDDILIELRDEGFTLYIDRGSSHKKLRTKLGTIDDKKTLDIGIIKTRDFHGSSRKAEYHSSKLTDIFYHLQSYLESEWNMELEHIFVCFTRDHYYLADIEEYERLDSDIQEASIKFTYPGRY